MIEKKQILSEGMYLSEKLMPKVDGDPWSQVHSLLDILLKAKENKKPFSLIRLGDGEGRILGYPLFYNDKQICDQVLTYQYGQKVLPLLEEKFNNDSIFYGVITLKYGIIKAVENADVIGVPSWLHFRKVNSDNFNPMLAQALVLTETKNLCIKEKHVFDHYIFRPFQSENCFFKLLENLDFLGLISHTDISDLIYEKFNVSKVVNYTIPGHQSFMNDVEPQYPNFYEKLIEKITVPYEGAMFLVAAGYLGKIYCDEIKRKGGIAIDIGAVFDAWTGIGRPNETKNTHLRL